LKSSHDSSRLIRRSLAPISVCAAVVSVAINASCYFAFV
jgi:hypothetical protein